MKESVIVLIVVVCGRQKEIIKGRKEAGQREDTCRGRSLEIEVY